MQSQLTKRFKTGTPLTIQAQRCQLHVVSLQYITPGRLSPPRRILSAPHRNIITSRRTAWSSFSTAKGSTSSVESRDIVDTEAPSSLTADQAQNLTALHVGNVYDNDYVTSVSDLAAALLSNTTAGLENLEPASLAWRAATYGSNSVSIPPQVSFLQLLTEAFDDFTIRVLLAAGAASLGLEFLVASREGGTPEWIEGASILAAVAVVVLVTAGNNWQKERQFRALQEVQADGTVRAIRSGREIELSVADILVGDLLLVEMGDILCVDGVLVAGSDIKVDESHLTGEPDDVSKNPYTSQALYSGSKVLSGYGRMLVTAVGRRSQAGAISEMIATGNVISIETPQQQSAESPESRLREETLLQQKLAVYAADIGRLGLGAAGVAVAAMTARFSYETFVVQGASWDWTYLHNYLNFFITGVTIVVVAVPEGLPLAVTISLAYSVMRMLADNNLVRHLSGAETMGTATVILTDKTGTLTQNKMTVTKLWLAGDVVPNVLAHTQPNRRKRRKGEHHGSMHGSGGGGGGSGSYSIAGSLMTSLLGSAATIDDAPGPFPLLEALHGRVEKNAVDLLCRGVALNSTANVYVDGSGQIQESGNRTEVALIQLAQALGCDIASLRDLSHGEKEGDGDGVAVPAVESIIAQIPFTSDRKRMTTVVSSSSGGVCVCDGPSGGDTNSDTSAYSFTKGAAEVVLEMCSYKLLPDGSRMPLKAEEKKELLESFQEGGLRLLCLAYRHVSALERKTLLPSDDRLADGAVDQLEQDLTLISIVGISDPLRPGVPEAISECNRAGIDVKMVTGDNAATASAIAAQCGILPAPHSLSSTSISAVQGSLEHSIASCYPEKGAVMEGSEFRAAVLGDPEGETINKEAFLEIWPRLKVLARCTPADKYTMVTAVRAFTTDIVAVTGDGTNDAPALRASSVGFAMNSGTQVAKEAADIILLDDNFASTVSAALWGRNVYANVTRFLQFQLTINLVAVTTAVGGAISPSAESPLSAVQMLWVNLIMDSLASLALATEPPDDSLLDLTPYSQDHQFIDPKTPMLKHILGQATYQLGVMIWLINWAPEVLGIAPHIVGEGPSEHYTIVFNAFVLMQLFNQVNARKIQDSSLVATGLGGARLFQLVMAAEVALQVGIVQWGGAAFSTKPLSLAQWALCAGLGAGSLLLREGLRRVPLEKWWSGGAKK